MDVEGYHGYRISVARGKRAAPYEIYWFNIDRDGSEVFRLQLRVSRLFAKTQDTYPEIHNPGEAAAAIGRRWVHGLIHLGRFEQGKTYLQERMAVWNALFGQGISEEQLRLEVMAALLRMYRAQQYCSASLSLDVTGIADVLGVRQEHVREVLADLELEGLIESQAATFGHGVGGAKMLRSIDEPASQASFGQLLRRYRELFGVSQSELAESSGVSVRGISDLERGARKAPHPSTIRRLAEALYLTEEDALELSKIARSHARDGQAAMPTIRDWVVST